MSAPRDPSSTASAPVADVSAGSQIAWILRGLIVLQLLACALLGVFFSHHLARFITVAGCYVLALVVVLSVHMLVTGMQFFLAWLGRPPLPKEQRVNFFSALSTYDREIDASMRGIWLANPFFAKAPLAEPSVPLRALPILCVHGYFCTRAVWLPFARTAAARGYRCAAITLEPAFSDIDGYVDAIGRGIDALLAASGSAHLVVVAHSMGALAVRAYLRARPDARVLQLVTLGAPHHGTRLATLSRAANARQMRRESAWLAALNRAETPETLARITSIYSTHDNIVTPYQTAELAGATNRRVCRIGHVSLLYSSLVWDEIFSAIEAIEAGAARAAQPTSA